MQTAHADHPKAAEESGRLLQTLRELTQHKAAKPCAGRCIASLLNSPARAGSRAQVRRSDLEENASLHGAARNQVQSVLCQQRESSRDVLRRSPFPYGAPAPIETQLQASQAGRTPPTVYEGARRDRKKIHPSKIAIRPQLQPRAQPRIAVESFQARLSLPRQEDFETVRLQVISRPQFFLNLDALGSAYAARSSNLRS